MERVQSVVGQGSQFRDNLEVLAESVETLCTVELTTIGPGRGIVRPLFESAVAVQGSFPVLRAARRLAGCLGRGGIAILSTGIVIPNVMPAGESDGPPGLLVLASVLARSLGVTSVVVAELETHAALIAGAAALGLPVYRPDTVRVDPAQGLADKSESAEREPGVVIVDFPIAASPADADRLLRVWEPKAIVVSERIGRNILGVSHTSTGMRHNGPRIPFELVVGAARAQGIPTVAVGDGGNEIGFGLIREAVEQHKPFGRTCRCGCGAGIACADTCDYLIVATVSNWGCYGLAAMIAGLLNTPELLPAGQDLSRLLDALAASGVVDGATGLATPTVDGIDAQVETSILDIMGATVRMALTRRQPRAF